MSKRILCLDFDGVCHQYTTKWQGADVIPDRAVPGLFEFLEEAKKYFDIQIFSTRSHQENGVEAMTAWFLKERRLWREEGGKPPEDTPLTLGFPKEKPPAYVGIDDRVITFEGIWPDIKFLCNFKPWNKREPQEPTTMELRFHLDLSPSGDANQVHLSKDGKTISMTAAQAKSLTQQIMDRA